MGKKSICLEKLKIKPGMQKSKLLTLKNLLRVEQIKKEPIISPFFFTMFLSKAPYSVYTFLKEGMKGFLHSYQAPF